MFWRKSDWYSGVAVPAVVFALGFCAAAAAGWWVQRDIEIEAETAFQHSVERVSEDVTRLFYRPVYGLNGVRGAYAASKTQGLTRAQFRQYVESRDLEGEFPGVRGFGFIQRVLRQNVDAFVASERADGAPQFTIRQLEDKHHDDLYVIKFIDPVAANAGAQGLDVGSEARRRKAAQLAVDTGQPAVTAEITLVQDQRRMPGVLLYVPVYANGSKPGNAAERRAALVGLLYAPIVISELLADVHDVTTGRVTFEFFHAEGVRNEGTSRSDAKGDDEHPGGLSGGASQSRRLKATRALRLLGREFTLILHSTPRAGSPAASSLPWWVFAGGLLASAMLAMLQWQQGSGRRRAEALARHMTADLSRLAQVVKHTSNAVSITDRELRITWVNEGFTRISGYTFDDACGKTFAQLLSSGKTDLAEKSLAEAAAVGIGCRVELLNRAKDGHEYWVDAEFQPLHDAQGLLVGFMEIGSEITASKQAQVAMRAMEAELRRQNEVLSSVLENLPCGLSVFDADLNLVAENAQFRRLLSLPDTLFDKPPTRFEDIIRFNAARGEYGEGNVEATVQVIVDRARTTSLSHQFERVRPDGMALEIRGGPMPAGGFVSTYTDISARRQAEAEAQRSAQLLRGAIDAIDEAFVLFDPDDRLVFCNDKYRQIFAATAELMVAGVSFEELIRKSAERGQRPGAVGRIDEWVAERMAVHRDGNSTLVQRLDDGRSLRVIERKMPDGHTVGFRIDITELVRASEQAQEAKTTAEAATTAKSQFLANMSHEIRTPMNAILGMLTLLRKTDLTSRQADYASKTEGAARSLLGLLNDILDFSKVEAGKMTLDPQPFRIDQLLRDLSVILSANVGTKDVEVLFDIDPALPRHLMGDAMRLQQVLINLTGNAIKFTTEGEVVVSLAVAHRDASTVLLQFGVRDTGIGIAPENQARIFSGFTQAEASTTRRFGGTGLGVAISQRLVGLMGGELKLDSALGKGSRFHFSIDLPVVVGGEGDANDIDQARAMAPDMPSLRALVVDDNPTAREVLERMGQSLGWKVDVAESGERALELLQNQTANGVNYQAVFVDWQMPGLDGWETSRRIREVGLSGEAPVVVMVTAHDREMLSKRSEADQALLDGFLVKPVTASMLFDAVVDARSNREHPHPSRVGVANKGQRLLGMRLLVAEDNLNNQQVARELLEDEGAIVQIANHGQEAVDAVATAELVFDVVLMDLQMPVMDGFTATSRIRQELGMQTLPIVAMTANVMASDREACLAAGMNDHVGKPFDLNHLVRMLRKYAGWHEADIEITSRVELPLSVGVSEAATTAGVDIAAALNRLGDNPGLYRRMLDIFVKELAAMPLQLSNYVAADDVETALRLLHTLKGQAATLGAIALATDAAIAEKQLGAKPDTATAGATLRKISSCIAASHPALVGLLQALHVAEAPVATPTMPLDTGAALAALRAITTQLQNADMAATDTMIGLMQRFGGSLGKQLKPMDEAISALDFERARCLCHELTNELMEGQPA